MSGNWDEDARVPARQLDADTILRGIARLRANAIEDEVPGIGRLRFAGYDDLVAMKRAAGRPQDTADLHELERVRDEQR